MATSTKRSSSRRSSRTTSRARTTRISRDQGVDVQKRFEELMSSLRELFANRNAGNGGARGISRRPTSSTVRGRSKATTAARSRRQTKRS